MICGDIHVCIDYRELSAFLQKEKMSETVIHLVISEGYDVRTEDIHDLDSGYTVELGIDYGTAEHIAGYCIKHVFLFAAHLIYITRKHGHAAHQLFVNLLGQKVAVHIVGM